MAGQETLGLAPCLEIEELHTFENENERNKYEQLI